VKTRAVNKISGQQTVKTCAVKTRAVNKISGQQTPQADTRTDSTEAETCVSLPTAAATASAALAVAGPVALEIIPGWGLWRVGLDAAAAVVVVVAAAAVVEAFVVVVVAAAVVVGAFVVVVVAAAAVVEAFVVVVVVAAAVVVEAFVVVVVAAAAAVALLVVVVVEVSAVGGAVASAEAYHPTEPLVRRPVGVIPAGLRPLAAISAAMARGKTRR